MMRIESVTKRKDGKHDRRYAIRSREFIVSEAGVDIAQVAATSERGAISRLAMHTETKMTEALERWEAREI